MWWLGGLKRDGFAIIPDAVASAVVGLLRARSDWSGRAHRDSTGRGHALRDLLREVPETDGWPSRMRSGRLVKAVLGPNAFVVRGLSSTRRPSRTGSSPGTRT